MPEAELTESDVEAVTCGVGAADAWTEAEAGVEG